MTTMSKSIKNTWNAFKRNRDPTKRKNTYSLVYSSGSNPGKKSYRVVDYSGAKVAYNQIAVDCAQINIQHVRLNEDGRYESTIDDSLNKILTRDANIDQTGRAFILDLVISLLEEGVVAAVPVSTFGDPDLTDSYRVDEVRVGKVVSWMPKEVIVDVYNEDTGSFDQIRMAKKYTPIIENPFYETMNRPNSTAQRLKRVLSQLDRANSSYDPKKLDMIIQLPYTLKSELKKEQAEKRRKQIEEQLNGSDLGIAYIDGSEKIIQLNRSLENNLWTQAKELQTDLYNQLGLCQAIFDGTADEATMLNYYNRTIEPILAAIVEEMDRKWISKTARAQKQAIRFFRDPFKLVPVAQLAELADKFTRNEIMSSNDIRAILGMKPDDNPKSDELINSNLNQPDTIGLNSNSTMEGSANMDYSVSELLSKVGSQKIA